MFAALLHGFHCADVCQAGLVLGHWGDPCTGEIPALGSSQRGLFWGGSLGQPAVQVPVTGQQWAAPAASSVPEPGETTLILAWSCRAVGMADL